MRDLIASLQDTIWADWTPSPIAADASARSYVRLSGPLGETVVVMNSGPVPTAPFVTIAAYLESIGLTAPHVLWRQGPILVLTDLGSIDLATAIKQGTPPETCYAASVDVLCALHAAKQPKMAAPVMSDLGDAVRVTAGTYAPNADPDMLAALVSRAMTRLTGHLPYRIALRDCHAENIIWRPDAKGHDRVGLLDFQDAVMMPAGYDLVSLIRDIRHPVPDDLADDLIQRFCAKTGLDQSTFRPACAVMGAQRNLRILGVFTRLIRDQGKTRYAKLLPITWKTLQKDLAHPDLVQLRNYVNSAFPKELK